MCIHHSKERFPEELALEEIHRHQGKYCAGLGTNLPGAGWSSTGQKRGAGPQRGQERHFSPAQARARRGEITVMHNT